MFKYLHHKWFQILGSGLVLFIVTGQALRFTGNPNYFPTVILLGSFVIPVTFIAYIYERVPAKEISLSCILICFLGGGAVGLIAAGVIEFKTLQGMSILGMFGVGLIEEACKLIFPAVQYIRGQYRTEADGILFGVASGMGFAALETMGYGLVALIQSQGSLGVLEQVLLIRGFLSPAGHAAWTGLICAVIWRERERGGHGLFVLKVVGIFILAVILHSLWNILNSLSGPTISQWVIVIAGNLIVAGISLWLLFRRIKEAVTAPANVDIKRGNF